MPYLAVVLPGFYLEVYSHHINDTTEKTSWEKQCSLYWKLTGMEFNFRKEMLDLFKLHNATCTIFLLLLSDHERMVCCLAQEKTRDNCAVANN